MPGYILQLACPELVRSAVTQLDESHAALSEMVVLKVFYDALYADCMMQPSRPSFESALARSLHNKSDIVSCTHG